MLLLSLFLQTTSIVLVVRVVLVRVVWPWLSSQRRTLRCSTTWNKPSWRARSPPARQSWPTTRMLSTNLEPSWPRRDARRPSLPDLPFPVSDSFISGYIQDLGWRCCSHSFFSFFLNLVWPSVPSCQFVSTEAGSSEQDCVTNLMCINALLKASCENHFKSRRVVSVVQF